MLKKKETVIVVNFQYDFTLLVCFCNLICDISDTDMNFCVISRPRVQKFTNQIHIYC